jgi:hypothetical protein
MYSFLLARLLLQFESFIAAFTSSTRTRSYQSAEKPGKAKPAPKVGSKPVCYLHTGKGCTTLQAPEA